MGFDVALSPLDVSFVAGLGSQQSPFRWIVSPLAGTGVVQVEIDSNELDVLVQGGLGLGLAIDLGIASGSASIALAVELNTGPDPFEIRGILSGRASVDVLQGLASATITLAAGLGIIPPPQLFKPPFLPPQLLPPPTEISRTHDWSDGVCFCRDSHQHLLGRRCGLGRLLAVPSGHHDASDPNSALRGLAVALPDAQLSLLAFPQRWTAGVLEARVLLLPTSAQVQTSGGGLPKFSGTDWPLNACVLPGLDALLGPIPGATAGTERLAFTAGAPGGADALFNALRNYFNVGPPDPTPNRLARLNSVRIKKELPPSYTSAFSFERPRAGTTTDNEFGCSLRDNVPALPGDPKPPQGLTWGAVLSYALRQPLLARALGLIHDLTIPLASPSLLHAGGWLYFELGVGAPVPTVIGAVRSYAAQLPPLAANATRVLFGAVLLPVGSTAAGDYGEALSEAAVYDDGFAKIVHASQAVSADATSTGHNELRPATDAGMDLGWDDEQVTEWLNRQVDALRARLDPTTKAIEAALGIGGYRIDVRSPEDPAGGGWASLCEAFSVDVDGNPAELRFPPAPAGVAFAQSFDGELTVEPVPAQSRHSSDGVAWLPRHFTRWQGGSLVVNDPDALPTRGKSGRCFGKTDKGAGSYLWRGNSGDTPALWTTI